MLSLMADQKDAVACEHNSSQATVVPIMLRERASSYENFRSAQTGWTLISFLVLSPAEASARTLSLRRGIPETLILNSLAWPRGRETESRTSLERGLMTSKVTVTFVLRELSDWPATTVNVFASFGTRMSTEPSFSVFVSLHLNPLL